MDLHADARIPFPRDIVFAAYRDDMVKLLPYLSNVRSIEVKSRKENGPVVELVNEWRGGGEIPAAVRAILSESMLAWTDYATWDSTSFHWDWRIEPHALKDALRCSGRTVLAEEGTGKTVGQFRGALEIDAKKIRGVPGFLAGTVGRAAEAFLVERIQSNLIETAEGMSRYLMDQHRAV
jgi:hypothetical protein